MDIEASQVEAPAEGVENNIEVQDTKPTESFSSTLPEAYREDKSFADYKDMSSLLKTYKEQEKANSKAIAFLPDEKASPEQWDRFYNKIGRPETVDGYSVPEKELPEGYERDEGLINNAREMAHKIGLRPEQFKGLFDIIEQREVEAYNKMKQQDSEFETLIDKHFGENKDVALENAKNIALKYLPEELKPTFSKLDNQGILAMSIMLDGIYKDYIKSDTMSNTGTSAPSFDETKARYMEIREKMSKMDAFSSEYQKLSSEKILLAGKMNKPVCSIFD